MKLPKVGANDVFTVLSIQETALANHVLYAEIATEHARKGNQMLARGVGKIARNYWLRYLQYREREAKRNEARKWASK